MNWSKIISKTRDIVKKLKRKKSFQVFYIFSMMMILFLLLILFFELVFKLFPNSVLLNAIFKEKELISLVITSALGLLTKNTIIPDFEKEKEIKKISPPKNVNSEEKYNYDNITAKKLFDESKQKYFSELTNILKTKNVTNIKLEFKILSSAYYVNKKHIENIFELLRIFTKETIIYKNRFNIQYKNIFSDILENIHYIDVSEENQKIKIIKLYNKISILLFYQIDIDEKNKELNFYSSKKILAFSKKLLSQISENSEEFEDLRLRTDFIILMSKIFIGDFQSIIEFLEQNKYVLKTSNIKNKFLYYKVLFYKTVAFGEFDDQLIEKLDKITKKEEIKESEKHSYYANKIIFYLYKKDTVSAEIVFKKLDNILKKTEKTNTMLYHRSQILYAGIELLNKNLEKSEEIYKKFISEIKNKSQKGNLVIASIYTEKANFLQDINKKLAIKNYQKSLEIIEKCFHENQVSEKLKLKIQSLKNPEKNPEENINKNIIIFF